MSPAEYIGSHSITLQLLRLGATREQLGHIRFSDNNARWPFGLWSFRASGDIPTSVELIRLLKPYCTLKWLFLEDPPYSRDREDAERYISELTISPDLLIAQDYRAAQTRKAKSLRVKVGDRGERIHEIIESLVFCPEHREMSSKELWPHFFDRLSSIGADPKDIQIGNSKAVEYDGPGEKRRRMAFTTFRRVVSATRRTRRN